MSTLDSPDRPSPAVGICRHLLALSAILLITLLLTNPLVLHIWDSVEDRQDALLNTWIIAWVGHALISNPLDLFNGNIFYPYPNSIAFSEVNLPQALLALPITLASNNPIFGYNIVLISGLVLDAFAMYLFMIDLTKSRWAAVIAGVIYAFNPYNLGNLAQEQLVWLGFLPLALYNLRRVVKFPTPRDTFLFALFFSLQTLASIYYGFFSALAVAIYVLCEIVSKLIKRPLSGNPTIGASSNFWRGILASGAWLSVATLLIGLLLTPFLIPYFGVQRDLGFERKVRESEPFSASLVQYTQVEPSNILYGRTLAQTPPIYLGGYPLDSLFPGLIVVILALVGLSARGPSRERGFLVLLLIVAFVLSLGPRLYFAPNMPANVGLPYAWLFERVGVMRALRAPVRFDSLVMLAIASLAGLGYVKIVSIASMNFGRRSVFLWSSVLLGLITIEYLNVPAANISTLAVASNIPPEYKWLAQQPPGVILELPMAEAGTTKQLDLSRQYFSTYHWHTSPDGYSGFVPPRRGEIAYEMERVPSDRSLALLRALDVKYLLVHIDEFTPEARDELNHSLALVRGLTFLKQFGATWVYRVDVASISPKMSAGLYVPNPIRAGAPFTAYLVLGNLNQRSFAVKPTDRLILSAHWSDGRIERVEAEIPLVTSSASVVPISLRAPTAIGSSRVEIRSENDLVGRLVVSSDANAGEEGAREVVIPARASLSQPLRSVYTRGDTISVDLRWRAENKIDAYYSFSLRVVDSDGNKVGAVDRQPNPPTLLWRPEGEYVDRVNLALPGDVKEGKYRVELLLYHADDDTSVLLLDDQNVPLTNIELAEIEIK